MQLSRASLNLGGNFLRVRPVLQQYHPPVEPTPRSPSLLAPCFGAPPKREQPATRADRRNADPGDRLSDLGRGNTFFQMLDCKPHHQLWGTPDGWRKLKRSLVLGPWIFLFPQMGFVPARLSVRQRLPVGRRENPAAGLTSFSGQLNSYQELRVPVDRDGSVRIPVQKKGDAKECASS